MPGVSTQPSQFPPYMAYSSSSYTSPQMPQYPTSYGSSYTSPLQASGFGTHSNSSHMPPLQSPHHFGAMGTTDVPKSKQEVEGDDSDGGVAISAAY